MGIVVKPFADAISLSSDMISVAMNPETRAAKRLNSKEAPELDGCAVYPARDYQNVASNGGYQSEAGGSGRFGPDFSDGVGSVRDRTPRPSIRSGWWSMKSLDVPHCLMGTIRITQDIRAGLEKTWQHLADLASHPTWMKDAEGVEFLSGSTEGIGTRMQVPTRVGPFRTTDILEVVSWEPGVSMGVEHHGIVDGFGRFILTGDQNQSTVVWEENLRFPWWWGGPITAWIAGPVLRSIWRGNLRRFARMVADA